MLVLSRKIGEQVRVPASDLVFTILDIRGDRVRLGICAPPAIQVFREEVWERIQHGGDERLSPDLGEGVLAAVSRQRTPRG